MNKDNLTCEQCFEVFSRSNQSTPCGGCPKPELWVENEWLWELFCRLQSQARVAGLGSFTGFDLAALQFLLRAMDVPEARWREAIEAIDMLSSIAIKFWNVKSDD